MMATITRTGAVDLKVRATLTTSTATMALRGVQVAMTAVKKENHSPDLRAIIMESQVEEISIITVPQRMTAGQSATITMTERRSHALVV